MKLLVIGADAAGMSAAHQALRIARRAGRTLQVVAVEATAHTSYSACGIPYWVAGDVATGDRLVARTASAHRAAGIDLRMHSLVDELDLAARTVTVRAAGTGPERFGFDEVVLATGAAPNVPEWALDDGSLVPGVHAVKTLDDGAAWVAGLAHLPPGSPAVIAGGGYIGVEMAEALLRRGLRVTLVTRHGVMGGLDPELGARVRSAMGRAGVEVVCGVTVDGVAIGVDGRVRAVASGGREFPASVVALGLGMRPRTRLAAAAGVDLGAAGGLLPDDRQSVGAGVWAAGDCCEHVDRLTGRRAFVPLGTHANKQGRVAGENAAGGSARFGGVVGTAVTRFAVGDVVVEIGRTGLTQRAGRAHGFDVVALLTESTTASGYMPESSATAVLVVAERGTGRLLGVQIVGGPGSAKRIDTAAVALWTGQTVHDVAAMDLSYAPPLSPVWDPVQIACRRLADQL